MPSASFERTYQHAWNQSPSSQSSEANTCASQLFFIAQFLLGNIPLVDNDGNSIASPAGLWTCAGSSDGTTGAMDGTNRWSAINKIISATAGNPHSWMVLKRAATTVGGVVYPAMYFIMDYSSASGVNFCNFYVCLTAPTGGSNTAMPTTTDKTAVLNQQLNDGTFASTWYLHGVLSTMGDAYFFLTKQGSGQAQWCLMQLAPAQPKTTPTADAFPYFMYSEFATTSPGVPSQNFIGGTAGSNGWRSRFFDNSGTDASTPSNYQPQYPTGGSVTFFSAFPASGDPVDGSYPDWPMALVSGHTSGDSTTITVRGRVADIKVAGTSNANTNNGKTNPPASPPLTPSVDSVIFGNAWFPCQQAPNI